MHKIEGDGSTKDSDVELGSAPSGLGRRDMFKKIGAGAGVAIAGLLVSHATLAQEAGQRSQAPGPASGPLAPDTGGGLQDWPLIRESYYIPSSGQPGFTTFAGPGWVNKSGRAFGNGPMDECSRRLVEYTSSFHVDYTDGFLEAFNYLMLASLADIYSGFESQPARINSRLSQTMRGDLKCTAVGYGVVTTPEMAAFTNACMSRHADFNDHTNELLWGVLAIGEALHSSGPQVIDAMAVAYEVVTALDGAAGGAVGVAGSGGYDVMYHAPATALACGKLMGMDKDELANALSLAIVPHIPLAVTHAGILSMWKGNHSAEQVRNGVWAALLASEGMTGPAEPFEGRDGVIQHVGPFGRDLRLPYSGDGRTAIESMHANGRGYKALPAVGSSVIYINTLLPDVVAWVKPEEVAAIDIHVNAVLWQEDADPPKFDPRSRETADHSLMYITCRGIIDKYVYIDSFTYDKYMDPVVREMLQKVRTIPDAPPGPVIWTIRKKSGEEKSFSANANNSRLSHDDNVKRYYRIADFMQIDRAQADRAREQWMNLRAVKDIAAAMQTIAKYGQPKPLSDKTRARWS